MTFQQYMHHAEASGGSGELEDDGMSVLATRDARVMGEDGLIGRGPPSTHL
jgi:hypothetical protein